jgi:hypothetical protein
MVDKCSERNVIWYHIIIRNGDVLGKFNGAGNLRRQGSNALWMVNGILFDECKRFCNHRVPLTLLVWHIIDDMHQKCTAANNMCFDDHSPAHAPRAPARLVNPAIGTSVDNPAQPLQSCSSFAPREAAELRRWNSLARPDH